MSVVGAAGALRGRRLEVQVRLRDAHRHALQTHVRHISGIHEMTIKSITEDSVADPKKIQESDNTKKGKSII